MKGIGALVGMAAVAASLLLSAPAFAGSMSGTSDIIKWYAPSAGGGHFLFESITLHEDGSYVLFESGLGTSTNPGSGSESVIVGSCAGCADVAVGLLEPGSTPAHPIIGDLFTSLTSSLGDQVFTFTSVDSGSLSIPSDPFLPPGATYGNFLLNETKGPIDIAPFIFGPGGGGYILTIQSDVPEPTTWAILLAGLFGMGWVIRAAQRRSNKAA